MKTQIDPSHLFRRIAVGVDPAGLADDAVLQAVVLAQRLDARLDFVHAVEIPPSLWPGMKKADLAALHAAALVSAREQVLDRLEKRLAGSGYEGSLEDALVLTPGHASQVLLRHVEDRSTELVLIGPHAKRSLLDFGSTARALISKAEIPVWSQVTAVAPIERILVPVDLSEHSRMALQVAHALAARLDARVRVLHAYAPPEFAYADLGDHVPGPTYVVEEDRKATSAALDEWMESIEWGAVPAEHAFVEGIPASAIQVEAKGHDLIVMGTHGRTGLSRFLIGSVAQATLREAEKPVLVVPSHDEDWLLES